MNIRPFEERDREACKQLAPRLLENVNPFNDDSSEPFDTVDWVIQAENARKTPQAVFVAEDEQGQVVGMVKVFMKGELVGSKEAYVDGLAVNESVSRQGVGTELMKACEDWVKGRGHKWVHIETPASNQTARDFYDAIGYKEEVVKLSKEI